MTYILLCKSCEDNKICNLKVDSFIDLCPKIKSKGTIVERDSGTMVRTGDEFVSGNQHFGSSKLNFTIIYKNLETINKSKMSRHETENTTKYRHPIIPYNDLFDYEHGKGNIWNINKGYNISNKHGARKGKCSECGGIVRWDSKHSQNVCVECGLIN